MGPSHSRLTAQDVRRSCEEGGCGACVVYMESTDPVTQKPVSRPINSVGHPSSISPCFFCSLTCGFFLLFFSLAVSAPDLRDEQRIDYNVQGHWQVCFPLAVPSCSSGTSAEFSFCFFPFFGSDSCSLAKGFHPVQKALVENWGSQCGMCSPGFTMSMYSLLQTNPSPTAQEVKKEEPSFFSACLQADHCLLFFTTSPGSRLSWRWTATFAAARATGPS